MQNKTLLFDLGLQQNVTLDISLTETFYERSRGLLALPELLIGQGLLIDPCRSIHTFSMKYALDIVYLDKTLTIVKIVESVAPNRTSASWRGRSTLELKAGEVERSRLRVGLKGTFLE